MDKKISVIIPCFDQAHYLEECLASCLKQTYQNLEIIVVDDCSSDGSAAEIRRLCGLDKRISLYVSEENKGAPYARNLGLSKSSGSYIFFLDADDYLYDENTLDNMVRQFPDKAHFIYGDKVELSQTTKKTKYGNQAPASLGDPFLDIVSVCPITCTILCRRELFNLTRWNEADLFSQDVNMIMAAVVEGAVYHHIPVPISVIRLHDSPTRISFKYQGPARLRRALVMMANQEKLKIKGHWNEKKEAYFSYEYCMMSLYMFYHSAARNERDLAWWVWKKVSKPDLMKSHRFRLLSWCGICVISNARASAALWKTRDNFFSFLRKIMNPAKPIMMILALLFVFHAQTLFCSPASAGSEPGAAEQFSGPFSSWRNVKTFYGAAGDGRADDTEAIQRGLDDLKLHKEFCVLYFPAGIYRITRTLKTLRKNHTEYMGVSLIGEHPDSVILRWDGNAGETMLEYDAWYSKISRLTLDAAKKASVCLAYGPGFSTYNETSDMVFENTETGLLLGLPGAGQAENTVLRCRFLRCSDSGILTTGFNSMDIWVWYCRFEDCRYGMHNKAGNFHAYQCLFLRSSKADIKTDNLMVFSFVNNTSVDSVCFIDFSGQHSWGSPVSITGNKIINCKKEPAIRLGNGGPYVLADNQIKSLPGSWGPAVQLTWGDQVLIGNKYTVKKIVSNDKKSGRLLQIDDASVDRDAIDEALPELPPAPINAAHQIYEVPLTANARQIQAIIDEASRGIGAGRPIVHFAKGTYKIDETILVPAGLPMELIGDGGAETATVLKWTGAPHSLVFRLQGPSRATLSDMAIQAENSSAILVENADQEGGKIYLNQLIVSGSNNDNKSLTGIMVCGVENSDVEMIALQGGSYSRNWVKLTGGTELRLGRQAPGQVSLFCGATGSVDEQYSVSRGARLLVRSVYHEMSSESVSSAILLDDQGSLTLDATRFSYKTSSSAPLIMADNFRGEVTLLTSLLLPVNSKDNARIDIQGDGSEANLLCMGNLFWITSSADVTSDDLFHNNAVPPASAAMVLSNMNFNIQSDKTKSFAILKNKGEASEDFIRKMLKPLRECRIWLPGAAKIGATNLVMHRLICNSGKLTIGVELRGGEKSQ